MYVKTIAREEYIFSPVYKVWIPTISTYALVSLLTSARMRSCLCVRVCICVRACMCPHARVCAVHLGSVRTCKRLARQKEEVEEKGRGVKGMDWQRPGRYLLLQRTHGSREQYSVYDLSTESSIPGGWVQQSPV